MKKLYSPILIFILLCQSAIHASYPLSRPALPSDQTIWLAAHALERMSATNKSIAIAGNKNELLARFHSLQHLNQLNAYHIQSATWMGGWTCGLFALKNAFAIEQIVNLAESKDFASTIYTYAQHHQINLQAGTNGFQVTGLGKSIGLKNLNILFIDDKGRLFSTYYTINFRLLSSAKKTSVEVQYDGTKAIITVTSPMHTSRNQMIEIAKNALSEKINQTLTEQRNVMYPQKKVQVAHFVCSIEQERHWILVSVVKFPNEAACYLLFDNLNRPITNDSMRMKYLMHLKQIFG